MSNKESHPIRNGAIASVIGGIVLSFWAPFRELVVKAISWGWALLGSLWEWLSSPHELYGWIITLLIVFTVLAFVKLVSALFKKKEAGVEDLYKSDHLFGANWQWHYVNGAIKNLWCLCPSCNSELVYSEFIPNRYDYTHDGLEPKTEFTCERCNTSRCTLKGDKQYALGTVEREIRRKIRNSEWESS